MNQKKILISQRNDHCVKSQNKVRQCSSASEAGSFSFCETVKSLSGPKTSYQVDTARLEAFKTATY